MDCPLDFYRVLGVSPNAGDDEIKNAYRLAARRFHPDVNKAPGAVALFRDINAAYETLSNPLKRGQYDQTIMQQLQRAPALQLQAYLSRSYIPRQSGDQLLYAFIKIRPLLEMSMSSSAPLNLALVIDRSKSMAGRRLQNVKAAARRIVDSCSREDILSVVAFSDRAEVVVPAQHVIEPLQINSLISTIRADGATAIFAGLQLAMAQLERNRDTKYVNHIILITDGRTYGDEQECLALASRAHSRGVSISGMGIGEDWHDSFLDELAGATGGASAYISRPEMVDRFLQERVRSLATAYAERATLVVAPTQEVTLDDVIRVSPEPMPLPVIPQPIPLGAIDGLALTSVMAQFRLDVGDAPSGSFYIGRVDVQGEVLGASAHCERVSHDLVVEVAEEAHDEDEPPPELVDALSKLAMYRLQDRAREAIKRGDVEEATRQLEFLATRLFELGENTLGEAALQEARNVAQTSAFSDEGSKTLRYGTRKLMLSTGDNDG